MKVAQGMQKRALPERCCKSRRGQVGARSAVGMASLPNQIPVEVEAIFELH